MTLAEAVTRPAWLVWLLFAWFMAWHIGRVRAAALR
jgi:hypothetical protein